MRLKLAREAKWNTPTKTAGNHSWTPVALQAPDAEADFTAGARKAEMQPVRKAKDERC